MEFDGENDYVSVSDSPVFDLATANGYTWSAWIKPDNFDEFSEVFSMEETLNKALYLYVHTTTDADLGPVTAGVSAMWESDADTDFLSAHSVDNVFTTGKYYHLIVRYDGSQTVTNRFRIYVDGNDVTDLGDVGYSEHV